MISRTIALIGRGRALVSLGRRSPRWLRGRAAASLTVIVALLVVGFIEPTKYGPLDTNTDHPLEGPSGEFWFGTDQLGRDIFARTLAGARLDLPLALTGTLLSLVIGVALGLVASTKGKWSERLMRGVDMFQAFPLLILAIVIVALTGNNLRNVVIAVAFLNVPRFIRLVRADALALRESRFIEACIAIGASRKRILLRHLLPNVSGTILVQASLTAAQALVIIAALGFLGIGITPPSASWGTMIQSGSQSMATGQWWVAVFPGLAVFLAIFCFNQIAEGIERSIYSRKR